MTAAEVFYGNSPDGQYDRFVSDFFNALAKQMEGLC